MALNDHAVALIKSELWAGDNTADVGAPSDEGISDLGEGFDSTFTTSNPPTRELFNGILRQLSALSRALITGILEWDTRLTYPAGSLVLATDNNVYVCQTSNMGNDPVSDDGTNWVGLLANTGDTSEDTDFEAVVTFNKQILLKNQSADPSAPANANDILLFSRAGKLKIRSTTLHKEIVLADSSPNFGVLTLNSQASAPSDNPTGNNRKIYIDSSGNLRFLNSSGNAKRIWVEDGVTNIKPSGYLELTNKSSVPSPASNKIRVFARNRLLYFNSFTGAEIVATRTWVNTQISNAGSATITDGSVTHSKLAADAVETDNVKDLNITRGKLANNVVDASKIASNAITGVKINAGAVTAAKLGTDAVETAKIKDNNVTHSKLAANAVETDNIKNSNVTGAKIAGNAIVTAKIQDGAVTEAKISDGAVTASKLGSDVNLTLNKTLLATWTSGTSRTALWDAVINSATYAARTELNKNVAVLKLPENYITLRLEFNNPDDEISYRINFPVLADINVFINLHDTSAPGNFRQVSLGSNSISGATLTSSYCNDGIIMRWANSAQPQTGWQAKLYLLTL